MPSTTDSTPKSITKRLIIKNLSKIAYSKQKPFSVEGFSGLLGLFPNEKFVFENENSSFVYLFSYSQASVHYSVSILNDRDEKLYTSEYDWTFDGNRGSHYAKFITYSALVDYFNGYVKNDKLILLFEIEIFNQGKTIKFEKNQNLNNLSENFESLLLDGKFSDVTLIVVCTDGEMKKFHVHKNILAARSPVFAAMFEHDFEENRENKVKITDISVNVFNEFVRFIYTGRVESLDQYALELLEVSDKYQVNSLKALCERNLTFNLTIESAANVLIYADLYSASELKSNCIDFIANNPEDKMKQNTEGWNVLSSSLFQLCGLLTLYLVSKIKN